MTEYVRQRNERDPSYRYNPNELYDYLVRGLCKNLLHKDDEYNIHFAKRGKADRTAALRTALETARHRFSVQWGIASDAPIGVIASTPPACAGLQAVDYFLWALQRLYERREDRYVEQQEVENFSPDFWYIVLRVKSQSCLFRFRLVHDLDDTHQARYGVYYSQKKPLTLAALEGLPGI